jgi:hypothetical protein
VTLLDQSEAPSRCRWCGRPFERRAGAGRPRQFCKRSCRQRDYESRQRGAELGLGEDELIITRAELNELKDRLYVLAETVNDVEKDLTDDAADDERRLLNVLLYAVKEATGARIG